MPLKDRRTAQAAAKKSWENRKLRNWRDQVGDLLEGKQITVKGPIEWSGIYTAAKRKSVRVLRVKISDSQFAVAAAGRFARKIQFVKAGNSYFTRGEELAN
jgi:hypothetical protein